MKNILIIILAILFLSCSDDSSGPDTGDVPDNNIPNIEYENISKNALGGDPRGTYFANEPLLILYSTDTTKTVIDSIVSSSGRLMYEFTGDDANQGDFTLIEEKFDIDVYLIWKNDFGTQNENYKQLIENDPGVKITGKWEVDNNILFLISNNEKRGVKYTSNSLGLFFITDYYSPIVGNYKSIMSYKRQ